MKLLFLGLVPVIIFWAVEDKFGTLWGIVAAVVWAIGECGYEYWRNRKVDRMTLFSTLLTVVLGGLAAWLDRGFLFKFQPVIIELVFAVILVWGGRKGEPLLLKMARQSRPEVFTHTNAEVAEMQRRMMVKMTRNLIVVIIVHCLLLSYYALRGTTGQWAFWKGIGFNVFVVLWMAMEYLMIRLRAKKKPESPPGAGVGP